MPKGKYTLADLAPDQPSAPPAPLGRYTAADLAPADAAPAAPPTAGPGMLSGALPVGDMHARESGFSHPLNWLEDAASDVRTGGESTFVGRAMRALGAEGTQKGAGGGMAGAPAIKAPFNLGETFGGPAIGPFVMAHGAGTVASAPFAEHPIDQGVKGINETVRGAAQTVGPFIAATNPEFLPALAMMAPVQAGATAAARKLGANDNVAELVGNVSGMVAPRVGRFAAKTVSKVGRLAAAPNAEHMTTPRGTTPAENFTPQQVSEYAAANNIPLTTAQQAGTSGTQALQTAGERAAVGGTKVKQQIEASQTATAQHIGNLIDGFRGAGSDGTPLTPAEAGEALQNNIRGTLNRELEASRQNYKNVDDLADGVRVATQPIKDVAQRLLDEEKNVREGMPSLDIKPVSAILKDITKAPGSVSFSDAQLWRSRLLHKTIAEPEVAISDEAQGKLEQLTSAIHQEMMGSASQSPGLADAFNKANAHWANLQEGFNSRSSALGKALQEKDPALVTAKFTDVGQSGGSRRSMQLLDQFGIDKSAVKADLLDRIRNAGFSTPKQNLGNEALSKYKDGFLQTVFTPQELDSIYKTGAIARDVTKNVNPSNTAGTEEAIEQTRNPVKLAAGKAQAWAATSPTVRDWLTSTDAPSLTESAKQAVMGPGRFSGAFNTGRAVSGLTARLADEVAKAPDIDAAGPSVTSGAGRFAAKAAAANVHTADDEQVPDGYIRVKGHLRKKPQ